MTRRLAKLFHDMNILRTSECIECHASDLIEDQGDDGEAVEDKLGGIAQHCAISGKTLLIKEAHMLAGADRGEGICELLKSLQLSGTGGTWMVIVSGSTYGVNRLLGGNTRMAQHFTEEIIFRRMTPDQCATFLHRQIKAAGIGIKYLKGTATSTTIQDRFGELAKRPDWANGRDVKAIATLVIASAFNGTESLASSLMIGEDDVLAAFNDFCEGRDAEKGKRGKGAADDRTPGDSGWVNVEIHVEEVADDTITTATSTPESPTESHADSLDLAPLGPSSKRPTVDLTAPEEVATASSADPDEPAQSKKNDEFDDLVNTLSGMTLA